MHTKLFDLKSLMEKSDLYLGQQIPLGDFRQMLGKSLDSLLLSILDSLDVPTDGPLILGDVAKGAFIEGRVYIAKGATVEATAMVRGPCIIGPGTEVRHGAYVRGQTFVGRNCVVGHATEVKGSWFLDGAKAGHFAYVGDSILGPDCNLGAGTKCANLKLNHREVRVQDAVTRSLYPTGLKKLGAIIGAGVQIGCNAVLSPGTILLPGALVTPCAHITGTKGKGIHS